MMAKVAGHSRSTILVDLLNFRKGLDYLKDGLAQFEWDSDVELVTLSLSHFKSILERYLKGELSEDDVNGWANLIEMREDIGFKLDHESILKELIFELANPEINGELTRDRASEILQAIK